MAIMFMRERSNKSIMERDVGVWFFSVIYVSNIQRYMYELRVDINFEGEWWQFDKYTLLKDNKKHGRGTYINQIKGNVLSKYLKLRVK